MIVKKFLHKPTGKTAIVSNGVVIFDNGHVHHAPDWMLQGSDWEEVILNPLYVKVLRCSKKHFWYKLLVGDVFKVSDDNVEHYKCLASQFIILKEDCVICDKDGKEITKESTVVTKPRNYKQFLGMMDKNSPEKSILHYVINLENVKFGIGDNTNFGIIDGFFLKNHDVYVTIKDYDAGSVDLSELRHAPIKKPEYEICSFLTEFAGNLKVPVNSKDPFYKEWVNVHLNRGSTIKTMVRERDGLRLSIGDYIILNKKRYKVCGFTVYGKNLEECIVNYETPGCIVKIKPVHFLSPVFRKVIPLFKTEKGEDVYEGDIYWTYNKKVPKFIWSNVCNQNTMINPKLYSTFLSNDDAEQDVINKNPTSLSLKEITDALGYKIVPEEVSNSLNNLFYKKIFKK